jgi:cellulose synthase/poly-beta-1,6-N-acetylglucosamine synthase-like glycosyltransferase
MISDRLSRRMSGANQALALVDAEPLETPCVECGYVISTAARFCRRCGQRQPMAHPLVEVSAGVASADAPDPTGGATVEADPWAGLPPPLVPLWGPLDTLRYQAATGATAATGTGATSATAAPLSAPADEAPPELPLPKTFKSFTAASDWAPRPVETGDVVAFDPALRSAIGRCSHRQRGRTTPAVCAICGGIPGPRVVTARTTGRGTVPDDMSAEETLSSGQRGVLFLGFFALAAPLVIAPMATVIGLIAVATALYAAIAIQRIRIFTMAMDRPDMITISDAEARAIPPAKLPIYTILIPAYREPEVIGHLLEAVHALDYPIHKLDVKLLVEQDDPETLAAALAARPGPHIEIVRIPPLGPRTKPKALVVGLARARGQYVTVFDAEDQPEPLQLRRAIVAFRRNPDIACLQAKLSYRNAAQNLITRWFTAEYAMWFEQFLPGLSRLGVPLPLGGTSNHFRRRALREAGSWDPFNVTEDADLGIRMSRTGKRVAVLNSTTYEEANSDFVNWAKQRSRWYKGYLQTWLIHMRQPRRLWRELGPRGFVGFNLFVGGTPFVAILNPIFWSLTALWFLARPDFIEALFPAWLYYAGLACLIGGNFVFVYGAMISARSTRRPDIVLAAALSPVYWVMMSIAAVKAGIQLVSAPSFFEKTTHGLDVRIPAANVARRPSS